MKEYKSLIDVIEKLNGIDNKGITFIKSDNQEDFVSYKELYIRALGILYNLQYRGIGEGEELIFQIEDNERFICTFWACILGGIIPVPVSVGNNDEHRLKLFRIWEVLNNPHLITEKKTLVALEKFADNASMGGAIAKVRESTILIEEFKEAATSGNVQKSNLTDIALIQFSSGSTGDPKGVILTHQNLMADTGGMNNTLKTTSSDSLLSWMPLTHDMGLIAVHICGVMAGISQYIMPTQLFIKQPTLWIKKAHEHKATQLYSPNFGYKHFLTFYDSQSVEDWDLSCVRIIINGAEPISMELCSTFLSELKKYGLKKNAMIPGYGLAEGTVGVCFSPVGEQAYTVGVNRECIGVGQRIEEIDDVNDIRRVTFADEGYPVNDCFVRICDDDNRVLDDRTVGYVQISGKNVTQGYYNNKEATASAITPDGWLNTGDLGFIRDGRLVITGRAKDIIFVNGQNYYPHDIERIAEDVEGVELGKIAACGILNEAQQRDDIVIFVLFKKKVEEFIALASQLKKHISKQMGLEIQYVIPVKKMPKTTSGKVQRYKLGERYQNGEFNSLVHEMETLVNTQEKQKEYDKPQDEIEEKVLKVWQQVLEVEKIGINDNFFSLGGNSLKATILVAEANKEFDVDIPITQVFDTPDLKEFAKFIKDAKQSTRLLSNTYTSIETVQEREYYPVSSAQKRQFILAQRENIGLSYNVPIALMIEGGLDSRKVEDAFKEIIRRHEALRTSFELIDGELMQKIHKQVDFKVSHLEANEDNINTVLRNLVYPFDLSEAPLLRVSIVNLSQEKQILMIDIHHIVTDGTSIGIMLKEFAGLYEGRRLPDLNIQYKDYASSHQAGGAWQNEESVRRQDEYWLKLFKDEVPVLNMPTDFFRPPYQSFEGDRFSFYADKQLVDRLNQLNAQTDTTLYMLLLAAYNVLLSKCTGQEDIVVGSPIAGRLHADLENVIGMFVNTIAMRNYPDSSKTFGEFLADVKENTLKAYDNQGCQFERLVEKLNIQVDMSRNPLFDTMFVLQNMGIPKIEIEELKLTYLWVEHKISRVDITIETVETDNGLEFSLEYCTKLFRRERMERLAGHFINILRQVAENVDIKLADIDMLSDEERKKLLFEFNNTSVEYEKNKTIYEMFEAQAEKTPDKIALVYGDKEMPYSELNQKANKLARTLRTKGVKADSIVAMMVERSFEMIIGILGVLKAGGAYLPIDTEYPEERIKYMLEDSGASILLTSNGIGNAYMHSLNTVNLKDDSIYGEDDSNLDVVNKASDLIYVIYTSGSTGKPKGVMIEHRAVNNFIKGMSERIEFSPDKTILALTTVTFDIFVLETLLPLTSGLKVVIADENQQRDAKLLSELIINKKIDMLQATPSRIKLLASGNGDLSCLRNIKEIMIGGEAFPKGLLEDLRKATQARIYNMYGPTETTVWSTMQDLTDKEINIGKPISNTQVYIVDKNRKLQSIGVIGELCISGDGLARGYWNRPQLTGEKFVRNPFVRDSIRHNRESGERMYRTGDLARWLPDGNIEFLGRLDYQVKIRGFRIELGEIELQLLKFEPVEEAVVIDIEDAGGNKQLCAYVVADGELDIAKLREHLSKELPDYMTPSYFVQLESLPLTPNGKVNRKALPVPNMNERVGAEYVAPRNDIEEKLAEIWQETLGVEKIGINESFYELGGHSISMMYTIAKISKELNINISLREFSKCNTVSKLAELISGKMGYGSKSIYPHVIPDTAGINNPFPLTDVQMAYLIGRDERLEMGGISTHVYLEIETKLNIERLNAALQKVIKRHPMLRAVILENGQQQILETVPEYNVKPEDISGQDENEKYARILKERERMSHHIFETACWPLFEIKAFKLTDEISYVCIGYDLLIADGASILIIASELMDCYNNPDIQLPELECSFRDYVLAYKGFKNSETYAEDREYWMKKLDDFPQSPVLPLKQNPSDITKPHFSRKSKVFDKAIWDKLKRKARSSNITPSSILCTAYAEVLGYWSNQQRMAINLTVFNRYPFHEDIGRIVGDFTSVMLLDVNFKPNTTFWERAGHMQNTLMEALEHRHYDGVEFIRDISKHNNQVNKAVMPIVFTSVLINNENNTQQSWSQDIEIKAGISQTSQVYLDNQAVEINGGLSITWDYVEQLFDANVIDNMFEQYVSILDRLAEDEGYVLKLKDETKHVIERYNQTEEEIPLTTLHGLFVEQVRANPNNKAVILENESISYRELHEESNRVAHYLKQQGIGRNDLVGVLASRKIETIVNIMGILKSGAAYVPVDPEYPEDRRSYILSNSQCRLMLEPNLSMNLSAYPIDDITDNEHPDDVAYVIYTSGSTGKPKGVIITHKAAANTIIDINQKFKVNENDRIIGLSSMCFDLSVYDIFGALSTGAALVMVQDQRDARLLQDTIQKHGITFWNSVPAIMDMLTENLEHGFVSTSLRAVLLSGDWIPLKLPEKVKRHFPCTELVSLGGATEASIWSIYYPVTEVKKEWKSIPYGIPLANQKFYVLNYELGLCPPNVPGELYIGGIGVAEGYLNDIEKTNNAFIKHPELGGLYKTGDYGVLHIEDKLPSRAYIEFLGRKDYQVKIRGYRVELGEIESCLIGYEAIRNAVVIDRTDPYGKKYLCAYIISDMELTIQELREYLALKLPDYMVPAHFVTLNEIPLTSNGKVDRKALPEPEITGCTGNEYIAPRNEVEAKLAEIWQKVLGIDLIGINDNFFELGGNSLQGQQLVSAIEKAFTIRVSIRQLFAEATVAKVGQYISEQVNAYKGELEEKTQKESGVRLYWSPVVHWEKVGNGIRIKDHIYIEIALEIFPEFYFHAQKGILPEEILSKFSGVDAVKLQTFVSELIRDGVLVSSLLEPQDVFASQSSLFKNTYGEAILYDSGEYYKFKNKQLNRTFEPCSGAEIQLRNDIQYTPEIAERRSYRIFDEKTTIPLDSFSSLLSIFKQNRVEDKVRYYYASAGGLYPIDVFVYVKKNRVQDVKQGLYYYNPAKNSLSVVNDTDTILDDAHYFKNKAIFKSSAFSIFLVYNPEANMPIYGTNGYYYACLDAGIMVGTLTQAAEYTGIGLCSIGEMNFKAIEKYFKLNSNQKLIHTIEGGLKSNDDIGGHQETFADLPLIQEAPKAEEASLADIHINLITENLNEPFPLTDVQYAYLIGRDETFEMGNTSAHSYLEIETHLDIEIFNKSLQKVINRHPMMRAIILPDGMQRILPDVPEYKIEIEDISHLTVKQQEEYILNNRERMAQQVFKSDKWSLFEFKALKFSNTTYYLFMSFDLLVADGASLQSVVRELMQFYDNPNMELPELKFTFRDYLLAYKEFKNSEAYDTDRKYWMDKLYDFPSAPALPLKCDPASVAKPSFKRVSTLFSVEEWQKLKTFAQRNHVTHSTLLCTAFAEVLAYWSNQPRLAIDLTVFNRLPIHEDVNKIVGDFTSLILLGIDLQERVSFHEKMKHVQDIMIESLEHKNYDGVQFIRDISRQNAMGAKAVMPIVFTSMLFNYTGETMVDISQLGTIKIGLSQTPQVFLDNQVMELNGGLSVTWDYVDEIFDYNVINSMFEQYTEILKSLITQHSEYVLEPYENDRLLIEQYNRTEEDISPTTLQRLFAQQVACTPNNIAVLFEGESLTYRELHEMSNQVAHYLRENGVGCNDLIGILGQRCIETIVNVMGILKSGGAYVPVDPEYPEERRSYILSNSNCKLLLEPGLYRDKELSRYPKTDVIEYNQTDDIAYVIYTSGSTGRPKGVVITHGAVTNTIIDINRKFKVETQDRIIGLSSMCFDLSVYDIFGALSTGACLVQVPDHRDVHHLIDIVDKQKITFWNSVPAIMDMMLDNADEGFSNTSLRLVLLSGDWIPLKLIEKIRKHFVNAEVISLGGATEASIWSIYYPITTVREGWKSIPYGWPLANQKFYALNYEAKLCPPNVPGELYIGGVGLAQGYMNDEEKTTNAFITHPQLGKLYRTGDYGVVRYDTESECGSYIEFLGRKDHQVKIRGYRIELGEIESRLLEHSAAKSAVVVDRTDCKGKKYLCAYIVSDIELSALELREHLSAQLPEYMIPAYFIRIDSIPLTPNGKVDRKRLPEPEGAGEASTEYAAPRNEIEEKLTEIWQETLGVDRIGINDSFFELGGDSIKAIQISARLQRYNLKMRSQDLFAYHTIEELSKRVKYMGTTAEQGTVTGEVNLTPVQKWFFERNFTGMHHWNQAFMLHSKKSFDETTVVKVFEKIVEHHDALRMVYKTDKQIMQINRGIEGKLFGLKVVDLTDCENYKETMKQSIMEVQSSMDLNNGPLVNLGLFKTCEGDYLLATIHHLVVDGISWRILLEDFTEGYTQAVKGKDIKLQNKTTSFKEWANQLYTYANSKKLLSELEYWKSIESIQPDSIPIENGASENRLKDGETISITLSNEETEALIKQVGKAYNLEINDILLTALGLAVKEWGSINTLAVSLEGHGREEIIEDIDISRTVGWFTSMYPVVLDMTKSEDISYQLKHTKENLRRIPNKGVGYGILKYLTLTNKECFTLKPTISFNYLGQFERASDSGEIDMYPIFDESCFSPMVERSYILDVVGMIEENMLSMNFVYNREQYTRGNMLKLAECYKKSLLSIIEHCVEKKETELTPSDLGYTELSLEELEDIMDLIN